MSKQRDTKSRSSKSAAADEAGETAAVLDPQAGDIAGAYRVQLPEFEGPLDLLLHLIQQHEIDILNIPISFITDKYLQYMRLMSELNIDLASEYLVMAATLAHIKSKMLLPAPPEGQDDTAEEELDPRAELVRRLLEYQKYRKAAEELATRPVLGRDVFGRGAPAPEVEGPAPLAATSVFKLFDAFQRVLSQAKRVMDHEVHFERISISERINLLVDELRGRGRLAFETLFADGQSRADLIVTFLAVLEMTRLRMLRVQQDGPLEPITLELVSDDTSGGVDEDGAPLEAASVEPEPAMASSEVPEVPQRTAPSGDLESESAEEDEPSPWRSPSLQAEDDGAEPGTDDDSWLEAALAEERAAREAAQLHVEDGGGDADAVGVPPPEPLAPESVPGDEGLPSEQSVPPEVQDVAQAQEVVEDDPNLRASTSTTEAES